VRKGRFSEYSARLTRELEVTKVRVGGNGRDETYKKSFPVYITPAPWCIGGIINDWRDAPGQAADEGEAGTAASRSANVQLVESGGKLTK